MTSVAPSLEEEVGLLLTYRSPDAYATMHRLLDEAPVYRYGDSVIVSKHADVKAIYRDDERFPQGDTWGRVQQELVDTLIPAERALWGDFRAFTKSFVSRKNGAEHTRVRSAVHRYFTPRRVETLRLRMQTYVDALLDGARGHEVVDLHDVAYRLPLWVIMDMLGVPLDEAETVKRYADKLLPFPPTAENVRAVAAALEEYREWGRGLIARHRADPEHTEIVSALLDASEGQRLNEDEVVGFFMHTLMAGHETTAGQLLNGVRDLMRYRDEWERLCGDQSIVPTAAEEVFRFDTPVPYIHSKVAAKDVELRGVAVPAGTQLLLGHASANRDPDVFDDPDTFNVVRRPNEHLTLGLGVHFCLGASVARAELQVFFGTLARRFLELELIDDPCDLRVGLGVRALKSLPARLGAERALSR